MGSAGSKPADFESEARGIAVMLIVLTTVAIISRLISRYFQPVKIGTDDYVVALGYVSKLRSADWGVLTERSCSTWGYSSRFC